MIKCSFAKPGTYGHECGKEAVIYAVFTSDRTVSGFFYGGRCTECKKIIGYENSGILRFEKIEKQENLYK